MQDSLYYHDKKPHKPHGHYANNKLYWYFVSAIDPTNLSKGTVFLYSKIVI